MFEVSVIGSGYIGLVTAGCLAEMGNKVTCIDINEKKINTLKQGYIPIYEPGLEPIVTQNVRDSRLFFTSSLSEAAPQAEIHFIAVGTPSSEDGSADLQYVFAAARELGRTMTREYNIVVDKSTVPVGTADKVKAIIQEELAARGSHIKFDVVSNPEFLKEGTAVKDFMHPDRIIIGSDSDKATEIMHGLYSPFTRNHDRIQFMGIRDAEMTKYAANAMLATKISFMNEIATLCENMGVDVENVRVGIGSDERIGYHFIYPGCGYGGSCFPKDVKALQHMARSNDLDSMMLDAVEKRNERQKRRLFERIVEHFGTDDLSGLIFGLWGLAFKPGTDDMREAPSLVLIEQLIEAGASIQAHDPVAMKTCASVLPREWLIGNKVKFFEQQYDALNRADAMVLLTEWKPYRNPDFQRISNMLNQSLIFDGRNQYTLQQMEKNGFVYKGIGRTTNNENLRELKVEVAA